MNTLYTRRGALGLLVLIATHAAFAAEGGLKEVSNNLRFDGQLVADPCELDPARFESRMSWRSVPFTQMLRLSWLIKLLSKV